MYGHVMVSESSKFSTQMDYKLQWAALNSHNSKLNKESLLRKAILFV
jgi:hypothetical protein